MPTTAITDPGLWLPRGHYLTFLADGTDAKLATVSHHPAGVVVDTSIDGEHWQAADPQDWATALTHVAASPVAAAQNHGRIIGFCHCGASLTGETRYRGTCTACQMPDRRRELSTSGAAERSLIRDSTINELTRLWHTRTAGKQRALWNAGPVIVEKLDATLRHVEAGNQGQPMPAPAHAIREQADPRFTDQVDDVLARLDRADPNQFTQAWRWVNVPTMSWPACGLTGSAATGTCPATTSARPGSGLPRSHPTAAGFCTGRCPARPG